MHFLKDIPIKKKLMATGFVVTGAALLVASAMILVSIVITFGDSLVNELSIEARIIGGNSTAALIFDDPKAADEILRALSAAPHIRQAVIYRKDGVVFAAYQRETTRGGYFPSRPGKTGHNFSINSLALFEPVSLDGEAIGTIYLESSLEELNYLALRFVVIIAGVIGTSFLVVYLLLSRLQRAVTGPIQDLAGLMQTVSREKDYTVRAAVSGKDELGALAVGFNEMLEKVHKRSTELEDERLIAEAASRAKSEFIGNISHELRTPLNAITGFSAVVADGMAGPVTDTQKEYLGYILECSSQLTNLITSILDLSQIDLGDAKLELEKFSVLKLFEEAFGIFRGKALEHNIRLEMNISGAVGLITADRSKIQKVVSHLLNNALKFTPDGGSVRINARHVGAGLVPALGQEGQPQGLPLQDADLVEISVTDTGIGIASADMPRLFKPFEQIEKPLTKKYAGAGFGLYLCKRLVELHGGRIWAESEPGRGSTFTCAIPARL